MEIHNINEIDTFYLGVQKGVKNTLLRGAYIVRDTARNILLSSVPNASKLSSTLKDTLVEGIKLGSLTENGDKLQIKIHACNNDASSLKSKTKYHILGTQERFNVKGKRNTREGVKEVYYKLPHSTGLISSTNAISKALSLSKSTIHGLFNNI